MNNYSYRRTHTRCPIFLFCPQITIPIYTAQGLPSFCCSVVPSLHLQSFLDVLSSLCGTSKLRGACKGFRVCAITVRGSPMIAPICSIVSCSPQATCRTTRSMPPQVSANLPAKRSLCTAPFRAILTPLTLLLLQPRSIATSPAQIHRTENANPARLPRARNITRRTSWQQRTSTRGFWMTPVEGYQLQQARLGHDAFHESWEENCESSTRMRIDSGSRKNNLEAGTLTQ